MCRCILQLITLDLPPCNFGLVGTAANIARSLSRMPRRKRLMVYEVRPKSLLT